MTPQILDVTRRLMQLVDCVRSEKPLTIIETVDAAVKLPSKEEILNAIGQSRSPRPHGDPRLN